MQDAMLFALALASLALIAYGLHRLWRLRVIADWPRVKATILSADLANLSRSSEDAPLFRPRLKYEYVFAGKTFCRTVLGISASAFDFHSEREAREFMAAANPGFFVDVLVNPAAPSEVFLAPGASRMRRSHYVAAIVSGLLVLIAGSGAWWMMHA